MPVTLTKTKIDTALRLLQKGVSQYLLLQNDVALNPSTFYGGATFQKRYNGFYGVMKRQPAWYSAYYSLMGQAAASGNFTFADVLAALHARTSRLEASFASKLYATLNPSAPVIDKWVLVNTRRSLPHAAAKNRAALICDLHLKLAADFAAYLPSADGVYLVNEFDRMYPSAAHITDVKKLDLVLWKAR